MDTLSLAVTGLALVLVLVMAAILWRLLRDERRRSDARVAALLAMSDAREDDATPPGIPVPLETDERHDFDLRTSGVDEVSTMFAQPERSAAWSRRMVIIVPLALIVIAAFIAFYPSPADIGAPAPVAAPAPQRAAAPAPLELLSLHHEQKAESLTVTGLVQNPRSGAPVSKVFATAFVFAADGTFLASGRAALDFTTLGPGEESPFVVKVPITGTVARYRIGFRGEDGRVIAHVDRRAGGTLARVGEERP